MGLSGIKRKQRISVDPQNKAWQEDTEKFGLRMLKKMGWTEGQGLGKNEDGSTENIILAPKNDNIGLGVKKKDYTTETYQQLTTFDAILKSLQPPVVELQKEAEPSGKKSKKNIIKSKSKGKSKSKSKKQSESESEKDSSSEEEEEASPAVNARLIHRRKFIRNKNVSQYSEAHLKEILGVLPSK